jgi:hypothetical protein
LNLSNLQIDQLSAFGISGTVATQFWVHTLLWAVWGYFGYQHLVLNWGDFTSIKDWKRDYLFHQAKRHVLAEALSSDRPVNYEAEPQLVGVRYRAPDGQEAGTLLGFVQREDVPKFMVTPEDKSYAEIWGDRVYVEISYENNRGWEKEFDSGLQAKQQYLLTIWFPVFVMFTTLLSGVLRWFGLTGGA